MPLATLLPTCADTTVTFRSPPSSSTASPLLMPRSISCRRCMVAAVLLPPPPPSEPRPSRGPFEVLAARRRVPAAWLAAGRAGVQVAGRVVSGEAALQGCIRDPALSTAQYSVPTHMQWPLAAHLRG